MKITFNEKMYQKDLIAEGGEGRIYTYKGKFVIKVYKDNVNKKKKLEKLKKIMGKNLPNNVAKPIDIVYNNSNRFIGFSMEKINGEEFKRLSSKRFVVSNNITKEVIAKMLVQIKNTLQELHKQGMYIGDLNDMNILFDNNYNVYFIDIDSWSVDDTHRCTVANDLFKDPLLVSNYFTEGTDYYAFAVLLYKSLTRLHPFGGVIKSNPDINTMDRMQQRLSVFSVDDIIIPPMVDMDVFLSSKLLSDLRDIFVKDDRILINGSLEDFTNNLVLCKDHNDYYYALFNKCPVCEAGAKEAVPIIKVGVVGGIPVYLVFSDPKVKIIFNEDVYLDAENYVVFRNTGSRTRFEMGKLYYTNTSGDVFYKIDKETIRIRTEEKVFEVEKLFNSSAIVNDNDVYFVSKGLNLIKFGLYDTKTSFEKSITKVSINNIFEVIDDKTYFICNTYDNAKIIDISGYNHELDNTDKITEYGIHHDKVTGKWLFIFENMKGIFSTYVFDKQKGVVYYNEKIRYVGRLGNLCFYNNIIFKPSDKKIIGFDYIQNKYKEFKVPVVHEGTNLIKRGKKFLAINDKQIYEIG